MMTGVGDAPSRPSPATEGLGLAQLSVDLLCRSCSYLSPAELCRVSGASTDTRASAEVVLRRSKSLTVVREAPFVDDSGLRHLLRRCPALVEIDIDARRLSEEGAAIIADALPRLTGISLRNGYGWSGIGSLTMAVARAAGLMCPRPPSTTPPSPSSKSKGGRDGWAEERTTQEEVHRRIGMRRGSTSPAENTAITPREQKPQHQQSQSLANPSSVTTVAKHKPAVLPPAPSAGAGTEGLLCWRGKRSAAGAKVTKTKVSAAQRERWPLGAARSSKVGPDSVLPSTAPPHGSWCYRQGRCLLALRSLVLCGLGPAAGLGNPSAEHFEEWACLAEASAPVLRSLTITNASAGQLPLCALTPFFGYPRIRSTASGTQANSPPPVLRRAERGRGKDEPPGAGVGTGEVRSVRAAEDTHDGLVELTLATVSSELAATVLRGVKRPVPLCFRREGGAAFPGGPRPPLLVLKRLNLVVDGVTDALCSAIAEGCPNVQEVSLRQKHGIKAAFSDVGPMALATCNHLTSLSLQSDHQPLRGCSDVGLVFMVMKLGRMEQLSLRGVSRATDTTAAAILDIRGGRLRQLRLEGCDQLEGHVFIPPLLRTAQSSRRCLAMSLLTSVSLARSKDVTPEALLALTSAFGPCLETLDLSHCCVTDDVLMVILGLPGLQDLAVCRCPFTNEGLVSACTPTIATTPASTAAVANASTCDDGAAARAALHAPERHTMAAKRPCARWSPSDAPRHARQPRQLLRKLNLAWCHGVQASGLAALLASGRIGRQTQALDGTGLEFLEDGHVEMLLDGLPRLQELRLSGCSKLTRSAVATIIRSACGKATLGVLDLRRCVSIRLNALALLTPPALPALARLAWWGDNAEAERMVTLARGGNCWVTPGSG